MSISRSCKLVNVDGMDNFMMIELTMIEVCYVMCSDYRLHEIVNKFGLYSVEYLFLFGMLHV